MTRVTQLVADFTRYAELIRPRLKKAARFAPESETAKDLQVERGVIFCQAMIAPEAPDLSYAERLTDPAAPSMTVVDRCGHHRPVYRGLLVYCWLQAFNKLYERLPAYEFGRWEQAARTWCDSLEEELGLIDWPDGPIDAGRGASVTVAAWHALALYVGSKILARDVWSDLASDAFGNIARRQNADGSFLSTKASDNPESHWYHELVLLHAAASYAVQAEDRAIASAVAKNGEFHLACTQPDHATIQPWAAFAFIWNPKTRALADQVLHGARTNESSLSLMLLADALYCLELFNR